MSKLSASLVIYDIPDGAVTPEGTALANPSPELREVGIRVNLSCWIVPNHLVPYGLLNDLRLAGASYEVVKFDISEAPKLLDMATRALRNEIRQAVQRARASALAAAEKVNGYDDATKAAERYLRSCRNIIKRTETLIKDYERSAEAFGIDPQAIELMHGYSGLNSIHCLAEARARLFVQALNQARKLGLDGEGLARACEKESGLILILADFLDDNGIDTKALREAFPVTYLDDGE